MKTLYLCGAGNPEGVRLALRVNRIDRRWDQIVLLDDDSGRHGQSILGVEIAGPFSLLGQADAAAAEVSNMVAPTTQKRHSAREAIAAFGLPFVAMIDPDVDIEGVEFTGDITIYRNVTFCATAEVQEGTVAYTGTVIGHGSRIGPGCIMAPGAVTNARVELGQGVYIGANASVLPDLKIGAWATVGSNSAVIQDVPAGSTVMGVPAQMLMSGTPSPGIAPGIDGALKRPTKLLTPLPTDVTARDTPVSEGLKSLRRAQLELLAANDTDRS